jgi:hypothetical protein
MNYNKIHKIQGALLGVGGIAAFSGLAAKANLAINFSSKGYINFSYFFSHLESANNWAYFYWGCSALFLLSLTIGMILEYIKNRDC